MSIRTNCNKIDIKYARAIAHRVYETYKLCREGSLSNSDDGSFPARFCLLNVLHSASQHVNTLKQNIQYNIGDLYFIGDGADHTCSISTISDKKWSP